ncbi:hypothetical protein Tco_1531929 [Tanacetum coccineum]
MMPFHHPKLLWLYQHCTLHKCFDSQDFYPPKNISSPKDTETPVESTTQVSLSSLMESSSPIRLTTSPPDYLFDEFILVELDNSLWIISRPQWKMPPKRSSTSTTPAITQDAIRQLILGIAAALEAQTAAMANSDNPNRNTGPREIPVAKRGTYKEIINSQPFYFQWHEGAIDLMPLEVSSAYLHTRCQIPEKLWKLSSEDCPKALKETLLLQNLILWRKPPT